MIADASIQRQRALQSAEKKEMVSSFEVSGRIKATRELVRKLLEKKFGQLPQVALDRINTLPIQRLEEIALSYTDVATLKELGLTDE